MQLDIVDKASKIKSPALSLCHEDQGGPANKRPVSLLMKTDGVELTEDIQKALEKFQKKETIIKAEVFNSALHSMLRSKLKDKYEEDRYDWVWLEDYNNSVAIFELDKEYQGSKKYQVSYSIVDGQPVLNDDQVEVVANVFYTELKKASGEKPELKEENEASRLDNVIEKTQEDNMTQEANNVEKVEIDKAALSDLQKAMEQLQKDAEAKENLIKSLQAKEEARDLQDVVKACDAFVAVEAKEELAKALFAVQKAGMGEESATIFKALNEIQKAAQEVLEKEAGVEGSDEATVEEVSENDLLKAAIASMKGE